MSLNVLTAFAQFLRDHQYSTRMWENGFQSDDVNVVCGQLTEWIRKSFAESGEFLMVWTDCQDSVFTGDAELAYAFDGKVYLIPNPFLEGDSEGFVTALMKILNGFDDELYPIQLAHRSRYNAV